jgi:hypothetical protein
MPSADNLATFMCRLSKNSGSLNLQEPSGPVQTCIGIATILLQSTLVCYSVASLSRIRIWYCCDASQTRCPSIRPRGAVVWIYSPILRLCQTNSY